MSNFISKTLEDSNGNKSSKRLAGFVLIGVGLVMAITTWVISLNKAIGDPHTSLRLIELILIIGGGLLTTGIFENVIQKWRKKA